MTEDLAKTSAAEPQRPRSVSRADSVEPHVSETVGADHTKAVASEPLEPHPTPATGVEDVSKTDGDAASVDWAKTKEIPVSVVPGPGAPIDKLAATVETISSLVNDLEVKSSALSAENNNPSTEANAPAGAPLNNRGRRPSAAEQSHNDREHNFAVVADAVKEKLECDPDSITKEDANILHSREQRAHGHTEKGGIAAKAQSLVDKHEQAAASAEAAVDDTA